MFKKIKKSFKAILAIIKNPWLLNLVLEDNDLWKNYVVRNFNLGKGLPVVDMASFIQKDGEVLNTVAFLDGGSLVTDHILLKSLASRIPNCSYFEIGTWRGESVKNVSEVAKECFTLNLTDKEIRSFGKNEDYINSIGYFSKNTENIIHLKGNSLNFDFENLNKKFDLIFIDGEHHYDFVKNDTIKVFKHLIHDESVVVWHDYGFSPEKTRFEVLAAILDGLPKEMHKNLYSVSNSLCAIYSPQTLNAEYFNYPILPQKKFKINVKIENII